MPDTFAITIVSIIIFSVLAVFIRGRTKNKCLKDFSGDLITLEETTGKIVWGRLTVESTGLELIYSSKHKDKRGHDEMSYLLYKHEYPNIQALIRYHDELKEYRKKKRNKELKRTYHPKALRRFKRKINNYFKTVKDSVMDIMNLFVGQAKRITPVGSILTSQDKYVSKIKQEVTSSMETSFEPLLERYIGKQVVFKLIKGDKTLEYSGILKDYTAEFIEIMDVNYSIKEDQPARKADLVILRKYGVIRHLGE